MRSRTAGKYRLYILNRDHPVHGELRSTFAKTKREWEHYTRWPYVRMWEKQEGNKENRPGWDFRGGPGTDYTCCLRPCYQ